MNRLLHYLVPCSLLIAFAVSVSITHGAVQANHPSSDLPEFSFRLPDGSVFTHRQAREKRLCLVFFHPESSLAVDLLARLAERIKVAPEGTVFLAVASVSGAQSEEALRGVEARLATAIPVVRLASNSSREAFGADECCDSLVLYSSDGHTELRSKIVDLTDTVLERVVNPVAGAPLRKQSSTLEVGTLVSALPQSIRSDGVRCATVVGIFSDVCPECEALARFAVLDRLARREGFNARVIAVLPESYSALDLENLRAAYDYRFELRTADTSVFREVGTSGRLIAVCDAGGKVVWIEAPDLNPAELGTSILKAVSAECEK